MVINKDLATVKNEIKIICGSCPSDKGDSNGLNVAIFNRLNLYCFICQKGGYEIKLTNYAQKTSMICEQCWYIASNKKTDNESIQKQMIYKEAIKQSKWSTSIIKFECQICDSLTTNFVANILACIRCWF